MPTPQSFKDIVSKKSRGEKIVMLTAYDFPMAALLDAAGVDLILVGDSLANVVLGLDSTTQVGMEVMLHHAKAVTRAVKRTPVVVDMPFDAYQLVPSDAVFNAKRFIYEAGCQAVKVEWFDQCADVVGDLRKAEIMVMGHVGLTPQTAEKTGGFKVRGKDETAAGQIKEQALALEKAGCFAMVLECVPEGLAQEITSALSVPTIGIGAGKYCDGQVLVTHDMLGLLDRKAPKFVKSYASVGADIIAAVKRYQAEVQRGDFPGPEQTFH